MKSQHVRSRSAVGFLSLTLLLGFMTSIHAGDPFEDAFALYSKKKFKEAITAFEAVPEDHPRYATAQRFIGYNILVRELRQPKKGYPYLKAAFKAAPWDGDVLIDYARGTLAANKKLIKRKHKGKLDRKHQFVVQSVTGSGQHWEETLTREELEQDLDVLEFLLDEGYSYAHWKDIDYPSVLDGIRSKLIGQNQRSTFALQVARFLTLFGDAHTQVRNPRNRFVPAGCSPFLTIMENKDRVILVEGDRSRIIDEDHPYVTAIDGEPLAKWIELAKRLVPQASPQWVEREAIRNLRFIGYLRGEMRVKPRPMVDYSLESADGKKVRQLSAPIQERRATYGEWPRTESRKMSGNIGYLRIPRMDSDTVQLTKIDKFMARFKETHGLIIDVRGNTGGSRHALRTLLPYFLDPDGPMRIVSVAARRGTPTKGGATEGYLQARFMYPQTSSKWTKAEAQQVAKFLKKFKPEWKLPKREFGAWHVMGVAARTNPIAYHYRKPVIVLMNEDCFSATDIFLGAFKGIENVNLMGVASGGGSGYTETYKLPHSRVEFRASRMASFRPDGQMYDGRGIKPDIFVRPILTDFLVEGTDSVLEKALKRLSGG